MNRRGFLGTLLVAPVAAVAAVTKTPPGDTLYVLPNAVPRPQRELGVARYDWSSFYDGFALSDDEWEPVQLDLFERNALVDVLRENTELLKAGFEENFDLMFYRSN